jgi:sugar/nucleoside kinase (ribokinase family)
VAVFIDNAGRHAFVGAYSVGPEVQVTSGWESAIAQAHALFVSGYSFLEDRMRRAAMDCLLRARSWGKTTFFDPGPSIASLPAAERERILALTHVLLLTEDEVALLGAEDPRSLLERGPSLVVVKRGSLGCSLWDGGGRLDVSAIPVEVVDSSGAGDCFDAAFVYGYLQGQGLQRAAVIANAMGAAMAARRGTGRRGPGAEEVAALLQRYAPNVQL